MPQKILFAVYDNGSYDHIFPMGFGALAAVLKRDGHDIKVWSQDMNHWPDDHLRTYLDENKFEPVISLDTGGAIEGINRADLFKGNGKKAERIAGELKKKNFRVFGSIKKLNKLTNIENFSYERTDDIQLFSDYLPDPRSRMINDLLTQTVIKHNEPKLLKIINNERGESNVVKLHDK